VVVWACDRPEKLGKIARELILDPKNELLISATAALELARLEAGGKLTFKTDLESWWRECLEALQAWQVDIDDRVARAAYSLPGAFHADPADRLLVATARLERATFLTADDQILAYPHVESRDARR
jgi:PIN domain nuclease of toxin-antitoxin system